MDIKSQRKAIYAVENVIENALDDFRETTGLNVESIAVQTILDDDQNCDPALKVNVKVSRLKG